MAASFEGRSALVTGAGSGIGAQIATQLAAAGARVGLVGRRREALEAVAAAITDRGGAAQVLPADVRDYVALAAAVEAFAGGRPLDILVANAAVADCGPIADADPQLYRDVVETNVLGVMHAVRAVLPGMQARRDGHIVVVASVSGRVTYVGEPAYVASKHATIAFAECLRQEVAGDRVRVTVIEPGLVETPLIHVYPGALDMVPDVVPLDPSVVASAALFALSQPPEVDVAEIVLRPTMQVL